MPSRSQCVREITDIVGSYASGVCVKCGKNVENETKKRIPPYDICLTCFSNFAEKAHHVRERLMFFLLRLEEANKLEGYIEQK